MYSLTICFGPTATVWTLLFKEADRAQKAHAELTSAGVPATAVLSLGDDFGQEVALRADQIHGVLLEDMDHSALAQVERGIHQARTQASAQDRAMSDPKIRQSILRQQQGPAVMSPVPNGRFNG